MSADSLLAVARIVHRSNVDRLTRSSPADFESVPTGSFEPLPALRRAGPYLPYCIDFARRRIVFVAGDHPTEGFDAPLLYLWQRSRAEQLVEVPFERAPELCTGPEPSPLFLISPGRTGSTLLIQLLRALRIPSISEPDCFTSASMRKRTPQRSPMARDERVALRACVEAFRGHLGDMPVIKVRGECCVLVEELLEVMPRARFAFLFRDRRAWAESNTRAFGFKPEKMAANLRECVLAYDHLRQRGLDPPCIWYEVLTSNPVDALKCLGVDASSHAHQLLLRQVLAQDSQQGTPLARAQLGRPGMSDLQLASFESIWRQACPMRQLLRCKLTRLL